MGGRIVTVALLVSLCLLSALGQHSSERVVSNAKELGAALVDETVNSVVIRRKIRLTKEDWIPGGTAVIGNQRHVVLQSENAEPASAVLDMGTLVDAIHVASGSHLELLRLSIPNSANRRQLRPSARVQLRVAGTFALWPSITLAKDSRMTFAESVFYYWSDREWDSCDKFRQATEGLLNPKNVSGMLQWSAADNQVFIVGSQNTSQSLVNMVTGQVHEHAFKATRTNHTLVCLPDPFKEEGASWPWLAICGVFSSLLTAAAIAHFLGAVDLWPAAKAPGTPHASAVISESHPSKGGASMEMLSSLVRDRQRASVGGLELGPLLGRGSFGKVYQGIWRGALVAVKVVPHDCSLASLAETLRESALSTSIQHPHVVTTFMVRTIRSQPGASSSTDTAWTQGQEGCLDEASGNSKQLYAKAMQQSNSQRQIHPSKEPPMSLQPSTAEAGSAGSLVEQPSEGSFIPSFFGQVRSRLRSFQMNSTRPGQLSKWASGSYGSIPEVPSALQESPQKPHASAAAQIQEVANAGADLLETWLILEFCDQGSFSHAIRCGRFTDDILSGVLCLVDIASGMEHLHSLGILHADLKGANVLLKSNAVSEFDKRGFRCKLADFGLSRILETNRTHVSTSTYGTAAYMPAELLLQGKMSKATDVYSFAMLMHELFTGRQLLEGVPQSQIICKVITGWRPAVPPNLDPLIVNIMSECWHADPAQRPSFSDILARLRKLHVHLRGKGQ